MCYKLKQSVARDRRYRWKSYTASNANNGDLSLCFINWERSEVNATNAPIVTRTASTKCQSIRVYSRLLTRVPFTMGPSFRDADNTDCLYSFEVSIQLVCISFQTYIRVLYFRIAEQWKNIVNVKRYLCYLHLQEVCMRFYELQSCII